MAESKEMNPVSGEKVETDGIYQTEWGREELLKRGDPFPSDVMMGDTEWKLAGLVPASREDDIRAAHNAKNKQRFHPHRGDR